MATSRKLILLLTFLNILFLIGINGLVDLQQNAERRKRSVAADSGTEFPKPSEKCQQLNTSFNSQTKNENFGKEMHLDSEKSTLQLAWTGENHEKIIIVTSDENSSSVWLSTSDFSFKDITTTIFPIHPPFNVRINLIQHPRDPMTTYISYMDLTKGVRSELYISTDASLSYKKVDLEFTASPMYLYFHPSKNDHILALDHYAMKLYMSENKGFKWTFQASDVTKAKWSKNPSYPDDIFIIRNTEVKDLFFGFFKSINAKDNVLLRLNTNNNTNTTLKTNIFSIGSENEFLYASIITTSKTGEDERVMQVSTDGGRAWNRVQLPTITSDRFYSIMDLSEGLIFLHVDNPGDTGRGVLYTSDATGIVFSKSLENHLFPNYDNTVDFYRVASSNGTFITSILSADDSIKTVISFDRGTEWHPITRPPNVPCVNEKLECSLHIHNSFSASHGINAPSPLSSIHVPGLIIAHGHVAESLQTSDPDVYVSNDGGHNWIFALKGPHKYQIADQGNLIFAIPSATTFPHTLFFSTDGGRCWVSHRFTKEKIFFKELLVTPDNKEKTLAIWGYTQEEKKWHSFVFDFKDVVTQKCTSEAYEAWSPVSHQQDKCVLGVSATFKRIKADSWCLNGASFSPMVNATRCECTEDDYSCDYGYKRQGEVCVRDVNVVENLHICNMNHHQKMVPVGYHKIPGDKCQGGFAPPASKWVNIETECEGDAGNSFKKGLEEIKKAELEKEKEEQKGTKRRSVFYIIFFFLLVIATTIALVYAARKYNIFRRYPTFKYSSIRSMDEQEGLMAADDEEDNDDDIHAGAGSSGGYSKISGPTLDFETKNFSQQQPQQTGYINPKLMALTNPHLVNNNNNNKKQQHMTFVDDDDVEKLIPESDVELLE